MELRKRKPGDLILTSSDEELAGFMENEPELHPIDEELNESLKNALAHCIEKLKAEQKSCIQLFYFENKCYREIAERLYMEEKKVKSYIQNGKRNLKICIENKSTKH